MLQQGVDISKPFGKQQFETAVAEVEKRMADGNIRRIKGNSYLEDLKTGNAVAGIVWSGDLFVLRAETEDENWEFVIPESGGTLWSDNMMVPITSTHRRNAETLMNYYYQPEVAAQVAAYVNYICPVVGAQEVLARSTPTWPRARSSSRVRTTSQEHNITGFRALSAEADAEYSAIWQKVMGN
jgi:spermidine/putrescine transport system substrate-binding protein